MSYVRSLSSKGTVTMGAEMSMAAKNMSMAAKNMSNRFLGAKMSLNLVIHEAENRVVFVESNSDFVDVLLGFLVTPVGGAVRQAGIKSRLGCMDALYKSVESLDAKNFKTEACKKMLLFPLNAFRANCDELVVRINDYSFGYHLCPRWKEHPYWSTIKGAKCPYCWMLMKDIRDSLYSDEDSKGHDGLVLRGSNKYFITDDLRVSIFRTVNMEELRKLGVYDFSRLREKKVEIRRGEALSSYYYF